MINEYVYYLDLQCARETKHNNNLYKKNWPKWDEKDPKKPLTNIYEYFESIHRTNKASCSYMLCQNIAPLEHRNQALHWNDPEKMMIERSPIIPIKQHSISANWVDAELLEAMNDLQSPNYLLDSAMC